MRLVLFGPPGSGKGTQAGRICSRFGLTHLSTGNILREEMSAGTELGLRVGGIVRSGALVSDEIVNELVFSRLDAAGGFLLDGYPRNLTQARRLDEHLGSGRRLNCALLLEVPDAEVVRRLSSRASCSACGFTGSVSHGGVCPSCGGPLSARPDDGEDVVRRRLAEYHSSTAPLAAFYGDRLRRIDGTGTEQEVWMRMENLLRGLE